VINGPCSSKFAEQILIRKKMKTALITGATEGIGFEFARLLAHKGINLILAARNEKRLKEIAAELSASNNINITLYAKDLSIPDNAMSMYEDIKSRKISVDYLINNAGFGINGEYTNIDWQHELGMYNLNMITLAYLTKVFAAEMVLRDYGRILNVGSTGSFQPGPFMAGYCASKAFVLHLSEAVNYELKGTNVSVSTLCPGVTDTRFHNVAQSGESLLSKLMPHATPREVAEYGFRLMMKGKSSGIHGFTNKLINFSNRFSSRNMMISVTGKLLKTA
jgi:uncharacterized protein